LIVKLYKYLSFERTAVLATLKLRFTQALDFNDPFEVLPNIRAFIPQEQLRGYLTRFEAEARRDFESAMRANLMAAGLPSELSAFVSYDALKAAGVDFVSIAEWMIPLIIETKRDQFASHVQQSTGDRIGILRLSANNTSLLMWAHYASSHRGFVLEFDSLHEFFDQQRNSREVFGRLWPVMYSSDRPAITMFDPSKDEDVQADRIIIEGFLTKSMDWSYEKEWRMFLPLEDSTIPHEVDGRLHLFSFPPAALTAIIFGARCDEPSRKKIVDALRATPALRHVQLREAHISPSKFEVIID
jgi:hypothetical protein